MLPAIEPATSTNREAAIASERRLANTRSRRVANTEIVDGCGTCTRAMTRSANPGMGLMRGRALSRSTISRSVSARSRQARHVAMSSDERWGPETGVISGPSYGGGRGEVSFFAQVCEGLAELVPGPVDIRLHRA